MLGRYDRALRARQPVGGQTLLARAIAAIRRNNGVLFYVPQNALGDGAPNLLSAPEDFSSASWVKEIGLTLTSGFPAPDGTNAAFRITSTAGTYRFIYFSYPSTAGLPRVLSVRVRAASGTGRTFRLAYGVGGSTYSEVFTATNVFQTFSVSFTSSATEIVAITDAAAGAGSVGFDLEIFGAKLEQGSTATAYTPQSVLSTRGVFIDSAGVSPVTNIADVIGRMTDRTGGGAVATQATTANKPTVQVNAQGRYVMRFDGSNDNLTTNITTGNEGWVCAGVTFGATSLQTVAASGSSNNSEKGVCLLLLNSTTLMGQASNGTIRAQPSMPITVNTPQVVSMGWSGAVVMVGVGNTESAPVALAGDMTGARLLRFGNHQSSGWPMNGPMTAKVICPVLPSAADRAIIRKWIGSLQGQTL